MAHSYGGQIAQEIDRVAGTSVTKGDIIFNNASTLLFDLSAVKNDTPVNSNAVKHEGQDWWDIAQSHFFTVQIYSKDGARGKGSGLHDNAGSPFMFASGEYKNYIPIKSMNFNYTSYDNMNIPFGIFGDFPLLHKKKVTSISFSCYDIDDDRIEKALKYWEQQCFPANNYVAFLDEVKATLTYTSYNTKGKKTFTNTLDVIPASSVSVSRDYESNGAKLLNFSVVAVGYPGASAGAVTGTGIIKERGYGDGNDFADHAYEMQVSSVLNPSNDRYQPTSASYRDDY